MLFRQAIICWHSLKEQANFATHRLNRGNSNASKQARSGLTRGLDVIQLVAAYLGKCFRVLIELLECCRIRLGLISNPKVGAG